MEKDKEDLPFITGFATRSIHVGQEPDPHTGAVVTPISLATTYQVPIEGEFVLYICIYIYIYIYIYRNTYTHV